MSPGTETRHDAWPPGSLLGRLPPATRYRLLELGTPLTVGPAEHLIREGQIGSHMVLLRQGLTKVTAALANGRQALLAIRVSGDILGEIAALNGTPRSATVTTCGPVAVNVIHMRQWRPFLHECPEAALAIAGIAAARFRWANQRRLDFAGYPAKVRLARILTELTEAYGTPVPGGWTVGVTLTQPELASLCGAAEPTAEKALRELRRAGVLDTGYRQIVVRDVAALRRLAGR